MTVRESDFSIRLMHRSEVDFAIELAAREGWNPGLHDAEYFYRTDPTGFFIGLVRDKPVGCISAVSYDATFAFIGLFIVVPEYRGKGFGRALWKTAMQHLSSHNIGLDGVVQQQANYCKSGFKLAYRNIRYQWIDFANAAPDKELLPLDKLNLDELTNYDSKFFGAQRKRFLEGWSRMPDSRAFAALSDGKLRGYGVSRRCRAGFKLGPLFADDEFIAEAILVELSRHVPAAEPIFLDVPEVNPAAIRLVDRYRMTKVFETARMYTGVPPHINLEGVFGVTTFELG
jgi:ribosomal protein S18 acetylase RimI-like enzyme